jgi:hypothetical protein
MDGFDENMKKGGTQFEMEPSPELWSHIEKQLDENKDKRRAIWLWWLLPFLMVASGVYWYTNQNKDITTLEDELITVVSPDQENPKKKDGIINAQKTEEGNQLSGNQSPITESLKQQVRPLQSISKDQITPDIIPAEAKTMQVNATATVSIVRKEAYERLLKKLPQIEFSKSSLTIIDGGKQLKQLPALVDSEVSKAIQPISIKVKTEEADSLNSVLVSAAVAGREKTDSTKKSLNKNKANGGFRIIIGTGFHNLGGKGLGLNPLLDGINNSTVFNSPGNPGSSAVLQPTRARLGFMVGAEKTIKIKGSNRIEWVIGSQYQYQRIEAFTGNRSDSSLPFISNRRGSSGETSMAPYYYNVGNNQSHIGHQHRLSIHTGLQLTLDKAKHWSWQNRIYGGIIISSDYLQPQTIIPGWVPSANLIRKSHAGLETGIQYTYGKWGTGVFAQQNVTASSNFRNLPKQYWRGLELRFFYNIPSSVKK